MSPKSRGLLREGQPLWFAIIAKHLGGEGVSWLCEAFGVSCSGFHAWLTWALSAHA